MFVVLLVATYFFIGQTLISEKICMHQWGASCEESNADCLKAYGTSCKANQDSE